MSTLRLPDHLDQLVDLSLARRPDNLTVACYTFPHYHRSAINDRIYGPGWTEYEYMRGCRPRFPGHHQPRTPMLGELDEREPSTWERYIDLAVASGVDVLIWDWYWYGGEPALHEALEEGFLRAHGRDRMRFAVMWTNHPWYYWFPTAGIPGIEDPQGNFGTANRGAREFLYPAPESPAEVWRSISYIIARYFHDPHYWQIDGQPVLVIWDVARLLRDFGVDGTRALLQELRAFAQKLGHAGIHFHTPQSSGSSVAQLEAIGFDSYGMYNSVLVAGNARPDEEELPDYGVVAADVISDVWPAVEAQSSLPFFPAVSPGWDNAPRCFETQRPTQPSREQWPGTLILVNETPQAFEALVRAGLAFLNQHPNTPPVLTIGCFNEWTEGQYLLPDTYHGFGMARALARGLGFSGSMETK